MSFDEKAQNEFLKSLIPCALACHKNSVDHGFWPDGQSRNFGEMISLMHSELSEALEGHREGDKESVKIPGFTQVEEEFADLFIRLMDTAYGHHYNLGAAILAKMKYNANRPHKHGKAY